MIRIEQVDASDTEWESSVARCGGNALHLPAIHLAFHDPRALRRLCFTHQGDVVACAVAFDLKPRRLRWRRAGGRTLHLPTAPAISGVGHAPDVWNALLGFARESGFDRLEVEPGYGQWLPEDERLRAYRSSPIVEFVIDLRAGEEAVLAGMHKTHRKNIRRAAKQDLVVEEDSGLSGLLRLRDMQLASSERASERAEGFAVGDEAFFQRLHEHVYGKGYGHILFARRGDHALAALAWLSAANRILTVRSGSLPEGYQVRAMYLLYDELIHRAFREGAVELNIGGVPLEASRTGHPQSGLYEFKNGFGGPPVVRHRLDIPVKEIGA